MLGMFAPRSDPASVGDCSQAGEHQQGKEDGDRDVIALAKLGLHSPRQVMLIVGVHASRLITPGSGLQSVSGRRPARGLRDRFIDRYDQLAPSGYPALHHLTSPLRRAAAAAGDPELVHLWAGTGWRRITAEPAGTIIRRMADEASRAGR